VFQCPSDPTPTIIDATPSGTPSLRAVINYAANASSLGQFGVRTGARARVLTNALAVTDGLSNTIAYAERYRMCKTVSLGRMTWAGVKTGATDPTFAWHNPYTTIPYPQFTTPQAADCIPETNQSYHPGVVMVALLDGSNRPVGSSVSQGTWQKACSLDDGQVLGSDW
jgi:hypothetical protein